MSLSAIIILQISGIILRALLRKCKIYGILGQVSSKLSISEFVVLVIPVFLRRNLLSHFAALYYLAVFKAVTSKPTISPKKL